MVNKIKRIFIIHGFLLAFPAMVFAYGQLEFVKTNGEVDGEKWSNVPAGGDIPYRIDSQTSPSFIQAIDAAYATWESFSAIAFQNEGPIDAPLFSTGLGDGFNTHSFAATDVLFGRSGLAFTPTVTDRVTGDILEADVYYNPKARWDTSGNPRGRKVDVQSVAFHEVGHFHGLSHSAITDATMFPSIQTGIESRSPEPDDQISPALIYPDPGGGIPTGSISGRIINGDDPSDGIVGGIVFAFPAAEEPLETFDQAFAHDYSGNVQGSTPAANTTGLDSGQYKIEGLPLGDYFVFVVPTGDGLIEANQISEYLAEFAEGGFPREFYNGADESNNELDRFARVSVNVTTGDAGGIHFFTETEAAATPAPSVTGADPSSGAVNTRSFPVTISGMNFVNGATVSFSGKQITVRSVTFVNAESLDINIRIGKRAEQGPRDAIVTNPDGQSGKGEGIFSVTQ